VRQIVPVPVVLVGERYWRRAVHFDFLSGEGTIDPEDTELFWFAETAEEIWAGLNEWYARQGKTTGPADTLTFTVQRLPGSVTQNSATCSSTRCSARLAAITPP